MMVSLVCLQTWLDGKLPSKVDMRMGKAFANEGIATKPGLLIVHVCSLSHQCRVLLLSLSHPFCVYVRSLSLSLRGYMVSHRSSLLRRSGRTALVVVHPLPNRQAPCRWSKHQHADGGALYLRPDGRLVSEAPRGTKPA